MQEFLPISSEIASGSMLAFRFRAGELTPSLSKTCTKRGSMLESLCMAFVAIPGCSTVISLHETPASSTHGYSG